mgnify:CR=1 FL=1
MASAPITMPTANKVQTNLMSYGAGVIAGVGFNVVSGLTGSGLIGGAVSSAVAGSLVEGVLGQMIAVNAGFTLGQRGNFAKDLMGGFGMNGNKQNGQQPANVIATI